MKQEQVSAGVPVEPTEMYLYVAKFIRSYPQLSSADIEDIVQSTYLKYSEKAEWAPHENPKGRFKTIAKYTCKEAARKAMRRYREKSFTEILSEEQESLEPWFLNEEPSPYLCPDEALLDKELQEELGELLLEGLENLKPIYREVIHKRYILGLSRKEVVQQLNITLPAYRNRLCRGTRDLREWLEKRIPDCLRERVFGRTRS